MRKHRTATVAMIGACMLTLVLGLATGAGASEFYQEGTADTITGVDNLGKTIVHLIVALGLPLLSAGMMTGGIVKVRRDPGSGGGMIAGGVGAGYLSEIVTGLHTDAAASVSLLPLVASNPGTGVVLSLVLQSALLAAGTVYARRRLRCGNTVDPSSMNRS